MKHRFSTTLFVMTMFLIVTLACDMSTLTGSQPAKATEVPTSAPATQAPTEKPAPTQPPKPTEAISEPPVAKGSVASLDDVKSATIQIQAEGTFIDPEVGMVVNSAGRGSGFIIDPSGIAVTNNHVVTGAALLKVWVGGNKDKVYSARVLGASECSDLAVIKIEGASFPYLQWYDGTPKVGMEIYAAGYPLGDPEYTLTKGIVSKGNANGNTSWASIGSVMEHDARINPGNSGGPLVDKTGKIVGVNYASNKANQFFAIARAEADTVLADLKSGKDVNSIGVNGQVVASQDKSLTGIWVSSVKSGSPADKAGVKAGDIIVQLEGLVLGVDGTYSSYCQILRSHKATDTLTMNIIRWKTQQILEGQLNGRQLAVTGTFGGGQSGGNQGGSKTGTSTITDDDSVITMVAPNSWDYDGSNWESTWTIGGKTYDFIAQTLAVSPDLSAYNNGWDMKGLFVASSTDWAKMGGYANLLEGVKPFYKECTPKTSQSYKDNTFEGQAVLYQKCGPKNANALVMVLRPVKNPTAYLVLFELKYTTQAEYDELNTILSTVDVQY